jgi:hypothetical protein
VFIDRGYLAIREAKPKEKIRFPAKKSAGTNRVVQPKWLLPAAEAQR